MTDLNTHTLKKETWVGPKPPTSVEFLIWRLITKGLKWLSKVFFITFFGLFTFTLYSKPHFYFGLNNAFPYEILGLFISAGLFLIYKKTRTRTAMPSCEMFWCLIALARHPHTKDQLLKWHLDGRVFTWYFVERSQTQAMESFYLKTRKEEEVRHPAPKGLQISPDFKHNSLRIFLDPRDMERLEFDFEQLMAVLFPVEQLDKHHLEQSLPQTEIKPTLRARL